ncbi:MAG: PQQ-dependent sugar dehydrogenase [Minicystis sp.]
MRIASFTLPLGTIALAAAFAACGGGSETTGTGGHNHGGGSHGGSGGQGGSTAMPAPFGLDARPANATCKAPPRPSADPVPVKFEPAFPGLSLSAPMGITQIPGDPSRFFVFQRNGTLVSFPAANPSQKKTVLTIPQTVQTAGEGGFLGFAFHPKALTNGQAFLSFTTDGGAIGMRSLVARMTSTDGGNSFGDYKVILGPFDQPYTNHDGGDAHFGNDGFLYLSFGDGGSGGDPLGHGQNKDTFFSKILRIDVDHGDPYAIPDGNPFKNGGGEPATFAYGFRNPFRFSIDRATGDVWVGDVGQNAWEEIDAKVVAGGNYGWNTREGTHCYSPMSGCATAGFIDPIYDYDHNVGKSITGGVVYRGKAIPNFVGTYLFADFVSQGVWSLAVDPGTGKPVVTQINTAGPNGSWVGFGEDNDGEVYLVDINGPIYKLVAQDMTPPPSNFPDKLSKTGCVDPSDATKPASGLIPYQPNSPLWSDGASKQRWLALPDGTQITVQPDGDFDIPIGSVLVKSFRVANKLVETRLLVRHDDGGWAGYTYEWDDDGKDATLLPSSKAKPVGNGQSWYYPSRAECLACHTGAAGRTLGLELGQLNADFVYTATNRISNQLATFDHIGLFDAPLPATVDKLPAYPAPGSQEGTVETRAKAYLHANCSFCHRPNSSGGGPMDLRFATALGDAKACDVEPSNGNQGVAGAKIIAPGDPAKSLLSVRPKTIGAGRMPPIASQVVDTKGTGEIDAWISSLSACPAPTP